MTVEEMDTVTVEEMNTMTIEETDTGTVTIEEMGHRDYIIITHIQDDFSSKYFHHSKRSSDRTVK